jgi:hypothetical protein
MHASNKDDDSNACVHDPCTPQDQKSSMKSHKMLKAAIPNEVFYSFIRKIAHKMHNSNYYVIDTIAYKKSIYCDESQEEPSPLQQFCNDLMPYYCNDKHFFLTRKMSHNNLNTILRQVCRCNAIECKTNRKYDKSKTQIVYYIGCEEGHIQIHQIDGGNGGHGL